MPVRAESVCGRVRADASAWLDDELDQATSRSIASHLETCRACAAYVEEIDRARSAVRLQLVEAVPDVADEIVKSVAERGPRERSRQGLVDHLRVGMVAAVVAALIVAGASIPGVDRPPDVASADEVGDGIRAAARSIDTYRATYELVERGWHPLVRERRFHAEVSYAAPDRMRLVVRDITLYPGRTGWPRNDVDLVANASGWWLREPLDCPPATLPGCGPERPVERAVVHRQPFDGSTPVPTDLVLPLESVAGSDAVTVVGVERVRGRDAVHVRIPYLQAQGLISSLQLGGSWRVFHPLDPVDVWLDRDTSFPLRFTVERGRSAERAEWARQAGYRDRGSTLFEATLTGLDRDLAGESFDVPAALVTRDGGFRATEDVPDLPLPRDVAGLSPFTSGVTEAGERIVAWSRGMQWLKMTVLREPASVVTASGELIEAGGKAMYYRPASPERGREVELRWGDRRIVLVSNLPRAELLRVAASIPVEAAPIGQTVRLGDRTIERLTPQNAMSYGFVEAPSWLPPGYEARLALVTRTDERATVSVHYRRGEVLDGGTEIRITHMDDVDRLWPSSERYIVVAIGDVAARFSSGRGELEWIDDGVYRAISAPGFDLPTIVAVAESLR